MENYLCQLTGQVTTYEQVHHQHTAVIPL